MAARQGVRVEKAPDPSGETRTVAVAGHWVLASVGESLLADAAGAVVSSLDLCCAVHERNGDCSYSVFSGAWSRLVERTARGPRLLSDDGEKAPACLCGESCWRVAVRRSIDTGEAVDQECRGGIRVFAAPICTRHTIVGAISMGHGRPTPGSPIPPPPTIEQAEKRLLASARLIGELVERGEREEALRRSEAKFRALVEITSDWVWEVDRRGVYTYSSPKVRDLLGYEPDEILGKTPFHLMPPADRERAALVFREALRSLSPLVAVENTGLHKDGRTVELETSAVPVVDATGKLLGYRGIGRDISRRKRSEAALAESERRFSLFMEHLPAAAFIKDREGRVLFANRYLQELFGWQDCVGKTTEELVPPEAAESMVANDRKAFEEGLVVAQEKVVDVRGAARIFETYKFPLDVKAEGALLAGIAVDTTERVKSERDLANARVLLQSTFEQTPIPMALASVPDGVVLNVNRVCLEMLGVEDEGEAVGRSLAGIEPTWQSLDSEGQPIPWKQEPLSLALQGIATNNREMRVQRKDGSRRWEVVSAVPIYNEAREQIAALVVFPDITERKLAEERILALGALRERLLRRNLLDEKLRLITEAAVATLGADFARVWVTRAADLCHDGCVHAAVTDGPHACRDRSRCLHLLASSGRYSRVDGGHRRVPLGAYKIGKIASGQDISFLTNDVVHDPRVHDHKWAAELGLVSFAGFRLVTPDGDPLGVFALFKKAPLAPDEVRLLEDLANTASAVVQDDIAEQALRDSETRFRSLVWNSSDTITVLDGTGTITYESPSVTRIFGHAPGDILGKDAFRFVHPDDQAVARAAFARMVENPGTGVSLQYRFLHGNGSWVPVESVGSNFLQDPSIRGIVLNSRDITERRRTEDALRESEARFRRVVESSPLPIGVADQDARIEYLNPRFVETFGYTLEDVPTLSDWFRLAYPDPAYRKDATDRWQVLLNGAGAATAPAQGIEVQVTCKDGSVRQIEVFGTPMGGKTLAVFNDLSERRRMEEERQKLEAQVREVQKLESLGLLAGGIAHDFNNLLMGILGNADLALVSLSTASPARHNVQEIARASERAADLCREMLAYSGKGRFVLGHHDLSEIVREMGQILEVSISKKAVVRYRLAEGLPAVEADATQMRQVVMNLITNASEALAGQPGIIAIETDVRDCDATCLSDSHLGDWLPSGRYVCLEVSDTGCGMDADTRRKIFDPFFTTKLTGRGLGLAAVLGIVRGHRGAIKVESEIGKGTSIKILLPAVDWAPGERAKPARESAPLRSGGTVLLVDDEPRVRDVASEMLTLLGFRVLTAGNGREGLEVFRERKDEITCVILDLTMPEMGGEEGLRELRGLKSDVRVILSSGYNEQEVSQRFVGSGLAGFIQKPYTVAKLRETLQLVLGPSEV